MTCVGPWIQETPGRPGQEVDLGPKSWPTSWDIKQTQTRLNEFKPFRVGSVTVMESNLKSILKEQEIFQALGN